jgi:hypothetical protein
MPQQTAFVGAHSPQQRANIQTATRQQPQRNYNATSSRPHIRQIIPQHLLQHLPQNMPQQRTKEHSQEATRKQPESNQQLAKYPTNKSF